MKTSTRSLDYIHRLFGLSALVFVSLLLACFGLSPRAQAVSPAPDGGYSLENTAEGEDALFSLIQGARNTAIGVHALYSNTTGKENTATGRHALRSNTTGKKNTAGGVDALEGNTTGDDNIALGFFAGGRITTGSHNIAVGHAAGLNLTTGRYNIDIASEGVTGDSSTIRVGDSIHTRTFIAGIKGVPVKGSPVVVDASGQLGVAPSSQRFKDDIKPMDNASEAILALKPITFRYKKEIDPSHGLSFGLVAEEVAKVNPDLVMRDKDGTPYTVRYDAVNAMLLNEFLKEYRQVQEQKATIAQLKQDFQSKLSQQQKQLDELTTGLQQVSVEIETSRPALETAGN
jgi:hypothetical protein